MSSCIFLHKNQHFSGKIVRLLKAIMWELCWKFFSSVFSFCKIRGYCFPEFSRLCVRNPASGLLQIGQKSERWQWRHYLQTWRYDIFFETVLFLLSSLVTGPNFMSISSLIFVYKGLTRNPEIGNTSVWVLPNIWRLGRIRDTKFVSSEVLLNAVHASGGGGGSEIKLVVSNTTIFVLCFSNLVKKGFAYWINIL